VDSRRRAARPLPGHDRWRRNFAPGITIARIRGDIDLAHPRVEGRQNQATSVGSKNLLRHRRERRHRDYRQLRSERESLRDTAADAHAGERPRPRAEGDRPEIAELAAGFAERGVDHGEQSLRVSLPDALVATVPVHAVADGHAAPLGGRVERQ
jgi:hypothetical protein